MVCVLQDTLTKGEQVLVTRDETEAVLDIRRTFESAMRQEATAEVERLTGRQVVAFMSANHVEPDVAVEIFMLQPEPERTPEVPVVDSPGD